ncbi:SWIM zinc finger family protein [Streptomyces sp. GQFP]|uniref:SWIM zinc finger family protein n=1 Tax=Streptomyces sp. GQFP TaxID=2907545 RepID=UPI001F437B0E|nr:SWIM zinc finger family protein [Streptomyces sp. GQFP]UIX29850.1 SWIM zinc finger family protein [Streptomyces sp. GQFP]
MPTEEHEDGRGPAGEKPVRAERPLPDDPGQDRPADEPIPGERPLPDDPGQDRPADAARRALRAARERATQTTTSATQGAVPGTESAWGVARAAAGKLAEPENPGQRGRPAEAAGPETRPGDAARAALRGATTLAGGERPSGVSAGSGPETLDVSDGASDVSDARHARADAGGGWGGRPGDVARGGLRGATTSAGGERPSGVSAGSGPEDPDVPDVAPDVPDAPQARPDAGDRKSGRPGDVAREALRAARGEALRARLDAEAAAAQAARRPVRPLRARDRSPGDRVRDVRELLAGSFELPADESPAASVRDPGTSGAEPHTDPSPPVTVGEVLRAVASPTPGDDTPGVEADEATAGASSDSPNPRATTGFRQAPPPLADPHDSDNDTSRIASVPSSMAAPGRDGELRRTFPALRAPGNRDASEGVGFAESWWGNAWVTALEEGALDVARLVRGRGYAEKGHVDAITVTPGLVLAYVQGSRPRPYRVQVRLRTLGGQEWERFLEAAVERPGHIAALLDKELPQSLADCGAPLLPGPGDLEPRCSCPDSGHPCKHAAALCYQTARLLDADPFVLLLLRGRGEREVLDELSRRNAARAARAAQEQQTAAFPGVRASDALAPRTLPPLPAPLPPRPHPEPPPAYPAAPGGPDPFALDQLATDAAARAHTLLTAGHDPVGELTLWQDAVRLAAARPGSGLTAGTRALYSSLARAAGRTPADLARAVAAWRQGGLDGLEVLEEEWDPPAGRFDRARPLLRAADLPAFRPWRNHLTHPRGHIQLRLGRDGLWYAYESEPGHDDWWPRGTPDPDPVGALTGLGNPGDERQKGG